MATIILKPTENCNSNCLYCDVARKKRKVRTMPPETLGIIFERINEYLTDKQEEDIHIIWHGGEPLLLGPDYFENAYRMQEETCGATKGRICHAIQSNLTVFSEAFVPVFRKLGIDQIGSSFDPVPHVRGRGVEKPDSDTYNRAFMKGDALSKKHGFSSGVIYVVTKKSLQKPLELFHYMANLKIGSGFDFHPVLIDDSRKKDLAITPKQFVEFLGAIFPVWWEHRERYPDVNPFKSYLTLIDERRQSLVCSDSGRCAYSHINIAPDGSLSHCGRSSDWGVLDYGNVEQKSFSEVMLDEQRKALLVRTELLRNSGCGKCRFWTICHGGCPLDSWFTHKDFRHKTNWCHAKRGFLERYFEPVTGLRFEPFDETR
ncbi:MAG: radical SAM protein [Nitrospirae bacterium]|nr:radical SAM protein [Nitrospirota bacterium]